jgi:hypothetical protein
MESRDMSMGTRDIAGGTATHDERDERDAVDGRGAEEARTSTTVEEPAAEPHAEPAQETHPEPASTSELSSATAGGDDGPALLSADDDSSFQRRWEDIQTAFVDEPRQAVERADELVAQVMQRLAEGFAEERERLEQQWGRGEDISTEDLRVSLQRYRAFFRRLLSA